jgi:hypothetical protein
MISGVRAALMAAFLIALPALPAAAQSGTGGATIPAAAALKPGQFVWYEQPALIKASTADQGSVSIVVSILDQQAYVYRGGRLLGVSTVSTGSDGHETPTGEFTILQKKVFHRSNLYSNAPMPYMQRLTWTGIALHAGHLPGYPASHGCVRFPKAFARQLYDMTQLGGSVTIVDSYDDPSLYAPVMPQAPAMPAPILAAETRNLGGGAYDVVTMRVATMRGDEQKGVRRPSSWVTGPEREIVQPVPPTGGK